MVKYVWFCLLFEWCTLGAFAQSYAIATVPATLQSEADVVKRMEKVSFQVLSPKKTILKRQYALTILNEEGAKHSRFEIYYSKLSSLKSFDGALYDADGRELKKIKWKDLRDESAVSGGNLMDDYRVKRYEPYHRDYPYTVVYNYEEEHNNSLFFENWQPVEGEKFAVQESAYTITYPTGTSIRYRAFNYDAVPQKTTSKGTESLTWVVKDLKAIKYEPFSKPVYELTPAVLTAPEVFEIEGYQGNMATWKSFGEFVYTLTKDRQTLPPKVKQDVQSLVQGLDNEYDQIDALYKYLQKSTRYISVQLGLGGWQPFDATYVAKNAYGDCKALVNYMHSLLQEAGIPAYYTLVRAGKTNRKVIADWPSQQFNHVILCVPLQQDTVWLECTSQTLPTGYLSAFTGNRWALLVDATGGKLVRTPLYGLEENRQLRYTKADMKENGDLKASVTTTYSGLQQDNVHQMIHYLTPDKIKDYLNTSMPLSTYEVVDFNYRPSDGRIPSIQEKLNITANGYGKVTGRRLIVQPNALSKRQGRLTKETRQSAIVLDIPYVDVDTVQIQLPQGYTLETIPRAIAMENKFGTFHLKMELKNNELWCYRLFKQYAAEYPASDYESLRSFYDAVYEADRKQVVMIRTATE